MMINNINNINNTNAWCQLVYKSLIFYYKNYKQLNQKLSKIRLLSVHSAQMCTAISYSRPRTRVDVL